MLNVLYSILLDVLEILDTLERCADLDTLERYAILETLECF